MPKQQFDNTGRGVLFKNDDKQSETHADYQGSINAGGVDYWLNAWIKTDKNGRKYMSLSVREKQHPKVAHIDVSKSQGRLQNKPPQGGLDIEDDIPFAPIGRGIGGHAC